MTPTPGPGERVEKVKEIRQRRSNPLAADPRSWPMEDVTVLLAHIATLDTALAASQQAHKDQLAALKVTWEAQATALRDAREEVTQLRADWEVYLSEPHDVFVMLREKLREAERLLACQKDGIITLRERAEHAEQRVAELESGLALLLRCNVWGGNVDNGDFARLNSVKKLLTPPPVAPSAKGVAHRAACDENHEHEVRKGCCAPDCPACHPVAPAGGQG